MTKKEGRKLRRGVRFPTQPLEEAIKVATIVQEKGGGKLSLDTTAVGLKLSSKSGVFSGRIASAKHFGLVEEKDGLLETTALSKRILRPTDSAEAKQGLVEAFNNFHIFKQLSERFQNLKLPEKALLENILVREYGISDVSKETAYKVFIDSGKLSGQIIETEQGLAFGVIEEKGGEKIPPTKINRKMAEFLENVGSLRLAFQIYNKASDNMKKEIEKTSHNLLEKTLALASELGLLASKMSLKIVADRVKSGTFEDIAQFVTYFEEGVKEDLNLQGGE